MKKIVSILLCFCMALGTVTAAYAAESNEMQKVLGIVKSRIGNTDDYENFKSSFYESDDGEVIYNFEWSSKDSDKSLDVTATADGVITSYSADGDIGQPAPISQAATKAEIRAAAEGFIKQLNPDIESDLKPGEINMMLDSAWIDIKTFKNGYHVSNLDGNMKIDNTGKHLIYFDIDRAVSDKFETGDVISKDDAIKNFKEKLGAELYYSVDYTWDKNEREREITPKYRIKDSDKYISAVSGDVISPESYWWTLYKQYASKGGGDINEAAADAGFSQAELDEIDNIEGLIAPKTAFENVKNLKCAEVPDIKFEDVSKSLYADNYDGVRIYNFAYYNNDEKFATSFYASVNAESGEVISFNTYTYEIGVYDEEEPEISDDEAAEISAAAAKEISPKKYSEYKFASADNGDCTYNRLVNGISVDMDNIYIKVNPETKKVSGYSINYTDDEFPDISGAISKEEAENVFLSETDYEVNYVYDGKDDEYKLCYALSDKYLELDAFSGKPYMRKESTVDSYTDVSGHYGEAAADSLAELDIGFAGGKLNPDEPIKQKEFAVLVQGVIQNQYKAVIGDDFDYDSLYDYIDFIAPEEVNPDGNVTRLDAAKFAVRAMGYINIAKLDIFKPLFSDVTADTGYVNILAGMNVMSGDGNGNFNPDGVLTRAQALIIMYNYFLNK